MRRRTRPKVVWLPLTNTNAIGDGLTVFNLGTFGISGSTGTIISREIQLVNDSQKGVTDIDATIADIASSAYRLRRIVGKIWCQLDQTVGLDAPASVIVTAGLIVRRANTITGASYASTAPGGLETSPATQDNTSDPWIWRRSWTLGNNTAAVLPAGGQSFPTCNWGKEYAGGISEGPHVDQKTARIVGPEERLFLDVTGVVLGEAAVPGSLIATTVAFWTDLRVLGSVRLQSGNRGNSSR